MTRRFSSRRARKGHIYSSLIWLCKEWLAKTGAVSIAHIERGFYLYEFTDGTPRRVPGPIFRPREIDLQIRWDRVREMIEEDLNPAVLIPVTEAYFEPHTMADEIAHPKKYVPCSGGENLPTAGYVLTSDENTHLAAHHLSAMEARGFGQHRSASFLVEKIDAQVERDFVAEAALPSRPASGGNGAVVPT